MISDKRYIQNQAGFLAGRECSRLVRESIRERMREVFFKESAIRAEERAYGYCWCIMSHLA